MKCKYCGENAEFQFKNGTWCCKKSANICPSIKKKNSESQKVNYKWVVNANNIKIKCKYCEKEIGKCNIKKHEKSCYNNPKNVQYCACCGKQLKEKQLWWKNKTCSHACSNTFFAELRNKPEKWRNHRTIALHNYEYKCEICGYNEHKILEVHHIDGNKKNNKPDNLILLCPICHAGIIYRKAILKDRKLIWLDK